MSIWMELTPDPVLLGAILARFMKETDILKKCAHP